VEASSSRDVVGETAEEEGAEEEGVDTTNGGTAVAALTIAVQFMALTSNG
jgi:hypothetical protein